MEPSVKLFKSKKFSDAFWDWFDNLEPPERHKFDYYKSDAAELYFFNKIYRHKFREDSLDENCSTGGCPLSD